MIGTSYEMLLWMSYVRNPEERFGLEKSRLRLLRQRLWNHNMTEEAMCDLLERAHCRCVRPALVLPAIISDKNHRLYDEHTFASNFLTRELCAQYGLDYDTEYNKAVNKKNINRALFKHLLKKKRAWIKIDKMMFDSVWVYDPVFEYNDRTYRLMAKMFTDHMPPLSERVTEQHPTYLGPVPEYLLPDIGQSSDAEES